MNKIRIVCIFLLCLLLNKAGVAQITLTAGKINLQQCVETAITNNLDVQQSNLTMQRSKIDWNQARLNLLPGLNGNVSVDITTGRNIDQATNTYINNKATYSNYGLGSDVILFNGLYLQNTIKQNALAYEASKMDWQQAKDDLTIRVILAYLQALKSEDLLEQSRNQATVSKNDIDRLDVLNKEGSIQPSQLSDLKGQYANDQLAMLNSQNALVTAQIDLCRLMNIRYEKNLQLERLSTESYATRYEQTADSIYQVALEQFSLVKAADLRAQSYARAVKAARGQMYPTLSLSGSYGTSYASTFSNDIPLSTSHDVPSNDYVLVNGNQSKVFYNVQDFNTEKVSYSSQLKNNRSAAISLNLRIPFFNSLFARNRVKIAKLTLKNFELIASTRKTQLQQSIEQAYNNMTYASDSYNVLLEQLTAYTESFRAATVRFNAGLGTSVDYLTAKNNLDRTNINVISAKYDYILRTKVLDYYQGKQLW
ncbi:MAG: TolC family protein [Chitinophagales bacterium]